MKYLQFFLIVFITACSSTKHTVLNTAPPHKNIPKVIQVKDSIVIDSSVIKANIPEPPEPPKLLEKEHLINNHKSNSFSHNIWNELLQKHVSSQGNVNYKAFKNDRKLLLTYITALSQNMPSSSWTKEDKLAYWINAYNAMTIDLILRYYPLKSIKDIKKPWGQRFWKLGDKWYNLNEIEHEILRKMNEPRIHFAIVCASFSCPKLQNKAFTVLNLDEQLTTATKQFLNDTKRNSISSNTLELSKIFKWFSSDFTKNQSLIQFLNTYSSVQISDKAKKHFKDYDWSLNE